MLRLLSANGIRMKKSRLFWAGLFAAVGYGVFLLIMNYIEKVSYIGDSIVQINWFLLSPFSVISLFCPVFCSIFIGTEYSDGTMRNRLIVGHTRKDIYLANFIAACSANIAIVLISSVIIVLLGTLLLGWHMLYPMQFLWQYLSGIMMTVAFSGFFTLVAMTISNKAISTVTCMVYFFVSFVLESVVQRLVFSYYIGEAMSEVFSDLTNDMVSQPFLEFLYDFIPMGQCFQITRETVLHPVRLPVYSIFFTVITVISGVWLFRKKDVK